MTNHHACKPPSSSFLSTVDVDNNLPVAAAKEDLRRAGVAVLFLCAHNVKYLSSALVVPVDRPCLNQLDAKSVV